MTRKKKRISPSVRSVRTAVRRTEDAEGMGGRETYVPVNKKDFKKIVGMQTKITKGNRTLSKYKSPMYSKKYQNVVYREKDPRNFNKAQKIIYKKGLNMIKEHGGTDNLIKSNMRDNFESSPFKSKKDYDKWYYENYRKHGRKKKREKKESSTSRSFSSIGRSVIRKGRGIYNRLFN